MGDDPTLAVAIPLEGKRYGQPRGNGTARHNTGRILRTHYGIDDRFIEDVVRALHNLRLNRLALGIDEHFHEYLPLE